MILNPRCTICHSYASCTVVDEMGGAAAPAFNFPNAESQLARSMQLNLERLHK